MRRLAPFGVAIALAASSSAALGACAGKSESDDGNDGDAGAGGSDAGGGSGGVPTCPLTPVGSLCVRGRPTGENESIAVGDPLRVQLAPQGCFSSSCTSVALAECSVTRSGPEFTVTAAFCLQTVTDPNVGCTADCGGGGYATCESGPLEAGDYTVTLGDLSMSFTVPGMINFRDACVGSQF